MEQKQQQTERDLVRGILNANSLDQYGNEIIMDGQAVSNKKRVYYGLMKAAAKGNTRAAELLLKQGGMIEVEPDDGEDPEVKEARRAANAEKAEAELNAYRQSIEKILKECNVYDPSQVMTIEVCATSLMSYRKMRRQYLDPDEPCYITELSREGMPRKKPNPLAAELRAEGACLQANLNSLLKNIKDSPMKQNASSALSELINAIGVTKTDDDED